MIIRRNLQLRIICIWICLLPTAHEAHAEDEVLRLGTGLKDGVYHQIGEVIASAVAEGTLPGLSIEVISTNGSIDNLNRMRDGEIDIALVQNDIAYYMYEGVRGFEPFDDFSAGVPLFTEYVQLLVRSDSDVRAIGNLTGKIVALGSAGSGSYHNALDVVTEAGLRPGLDFEAVYLNVDEATPKVTSGELDAIITTGALFPAQPQRLRPVSLPQEIVSSLARHSPYYIPEVTEVGVGEYRKTISTVSVMAVLIFSDRISTAQALGVARSIDEAKSSLREVADGALSFIPIEEADARRPVPLHPGVRSYLLSMGYAKGSSTLYWTILVGAMVILLVVYAQLRCNAYDRLGNVRSSTGAWQYKFLLAISRFNTLIIVAVIFVLFMFVLVETIQFFEAEYAREQNIRNKFADIGFWQAVLWMFMFMGAGHTENMFPLSTAGRILATTLPFLGIGGILGFSLLGLDESRARVAARKRGRLPSKARNHVLVCGWNEKAIRIIYSLTCDDVPRKKPVVVVAEIEGDMPLENHDFDPRYVSYQRGDSADHSVLERANIQYADAAVVVAGVKKRAGRNVRSILSVMALKESYAKKNPRRTGKEDELFVAAELVHDENRALFHACGADAVVTAEVVANRLAAQCCVNLHIVDFVLDALTYDDASELYSTRVSRIGKPSVGFYFWKERLERFLGKHEVPPPLVGRSLGEVRNSLSGHGINVVALAKSRGHADVLVDDIFDNGHYMFPKDAEDRQVILSDDQVLLFMADRHRDIHRAATKTSTWKDREYTDEEESKHGLFFNPSPRHVLLVGDWERCASVAKMLEHVPWCKTSILTESLPDSASGSERCVVGSLSCKENWEAAGIGEVDQITILAQPGEQTNLGQGFGEHGEIDARAIFAARFARSFSRSVERSSHKAAPIIAAEMLGHESRELFRDAGIDVVIPSSLLVERMLTKLVYSKGSVCRFLMALLAFDDDRHIMTLVLSEEEHGQLIGKSFEQLMRILPTGIQLLGVLPVNADLRGKLKNRVGDFEYHFLTTPGRNDSGDYRSTIGDELLVIVDRREKKS